MNNVPQNVKYTKNHEWARQLPDGNIEVGITDHAQDLLGDMVYVEPPKAGARVTAGKECAVVESVKAASDIYAPVSGEIAAVNTELVDAPEKVNKDPYGEGWMFRIKPDNQSEFGELLDGDAYQAVIASEQE